MNRFFWLSLLILASISVAFAQDGPRVTASPLRKSLNLSDLPSAESARDNMGLPDNVEQAGSVASLGVNVFTGKQTMTQSVSKGSTLWHGHFENEGTGAGSYLGVYLGTPNRYGYIRGFDYDYGTFGLADSLEFGSNDFGAIRLHQTLATGVVGIMFGNSAPYTAVATWTADGVMLNAGDIIANGVNVVDGIASAEAMAASQNALASSAYSFASDTRSISAAMDNSQNALASSAADFSSGTRAILTTLASAVATGTSGTKVPLLDGANTWSATQTMSGLVVDTSTIYVDEGQHRVGIATTTPAEKLHVIGNTRIDNGNLIFGTSGKGIVTASSAYLLSLNGGTSLSSTQGAGIDLYGNNHGTYAGKMVLYPGTVASGVLEFRTAGSMKMTLAYNGNFGIATTTPGYLLVMESSGGGYYSAADHDWHTGTSLTERKFDITALDFDPIVALDGLTIYKYRYKKYTEEKSPLTGEVVASSWEEDPDAPETYGYLAEEVPAALSKMIAPTGEIGTRNAFAFLVSVCKAQQAEIASLTARIEALEAK